MRTFKTISLAIALASGASVASAGNIDRVQLADCKAALGSVYGDDYQFRLKAVRGGRVKKMAIKAIPPEGNSAVVTCWRDRTTREIHMEDRDGVALAPQAGEEDKVAMNN